MIYEDRIVRCWRFCFLLSLLIVLYSKAIGNSGTAPNIVLSGLLDTHIECSCPDYNITSFSPISCLPYISRCTQACHWHSQVVSRSSLALLGES